MVFHVSLNSHNTKLVNHGVEWGLLNQELIQSSVWVVGVLALLCKLTNSQKAKECQAASNLKYVKAV